MTVGADETSPLLAILREIEANGPREITPAEARSILHRIHGLKRKIGDLRVERDGFRERVRQAELSRNAAEKELAGWRAREMQLVHQATRAGDGAQAITLLLTLETEISEFLGRKRNRGGE
jgi:hypothetical protein